MHILLAAAACAMTVSLAGCGGGSVSDNEMRSSLRENAVSSCIAASRTSPDGSRFDWPRLCGCAIDRYMAGRSTSDLRNADPQDPSRRAASRQCAMEQLGVAPDVLPDGQENGPGRAADRPSPGGPALTGDRQIIS
jgi:hypothetical protein